MMNPVFKLFFLFFAFVVTAQEVAADEWRGLEPLSSTRADVVRLFGECANDKRACEFAIENEDILIVFSGPNDCDGVPEGTVLSIQRELQTATTFGALNLDRRRFKSFDPSIPRNTGYRGFINEESGLLLKTFRGEVFQINHIAPKKQWQVCQGYYQRPRKFVEVIIPHVMTVQSVRCPESIPVAGEKVVIAGNYVRTGQRILVLWDISHGQILKGQNTRRILLDTTGLQGKTITVTLEVNDGDQHIASGTCSFSVSSRANN